MSSPGTKKVPLCLLRPFKNSDQEAVKKIMNDAAMETVWEYFMGALMSEIFPQLAFASIAVGFLGYSLPFYYCLSLIPASVVMMYMVIWTSHFVKAMELSNDMHTVARTYQQEPDTNFWVAEVYDDVLSSELSAHFNDTKKVVYQFLSQEELDKRGDNLGDYKHHTVVACLGLTKCETKPTKSWLRRFSVSQHYRRRGVAMQLLELAVQFSRDKGYKAVELITTDCHAKARSMYHKAGFAVTMGSKHFLGVSQYRYLFTMTLNTAEEKRPQQTAETEQNALLQPKRFEEVCTKKDI